MRTRREREELAEIAGLKGPLSSAGYRLEIFFGKLDTSLLATASNSSGVFAATSFALVSSLRLSNSLLLMIELPL